MKRQLLLLAILATCACTYSYSQAPSWIWANGSSGIFNFANSLAVDAAGNVYITGGFLSTVDFDPGPGTTTLTSAGVHDIIVCKYTPSGDLIWAKQMGGTTGDGGIVIKFDPTGNGSIIVGGWFSGTADLDPGVGVLNFTSFGNNDMFITKMDTSGNLLWSRQIGGTTNSDYINALSVDSSGNVIFSGYFNGTADFDPGPNNFDLTSAGFTDIFIAKLNGSGVFVWANRIGGIGNDNSQGMETDASGNIYTTGYFYDLVDFDPGAGVANLNSAGGGFPNLFVAKYDNSGGYLWAKAIGDISGYANGKAIAVDGSGDIYMTGVFTGQADFDTSPAVQNLYSAGSDDIFLMKLTNSGNYVWAKAIGGTGVDKSSAITLDVASSDIYIAGDFEATVDFDPGTGISNVTSAGKADFAIAKFTNTGIFSWVKSSGGTENDYCKGISIDLSGHLYATGNFGSSSITMDAFILNITPPFSTCIFTAKLDSLAIATGSYDLENYGNDVLVYPNPASDHFTITLGKGHKKIEVTISDISGKIIYKIKATETQKIEANLKDFAEGVYVVQIQATDFIETIKLIVAK